MYCMFCYIKESIYVSLIVIAWAKITLIVLLKKGHLYLGSSEEAAKKSSLVLFLFLSKKNYNNYY